MIRNLIAAIPPEVAKWFAYALVLLAPGSFVVLPLWWLARRVRKCVEPAWKRPARRGI